MDIQSAEIAVKDYIEQQGQKSLLRFITCGSVDDGKSTLIGRLLYESKLLFEDQISALESDSARLGTQGDEIDFALLVDGLASEREQGITIDVAYRFFNTDARKYIVIDTPGHEQYTRNMATGASQAQLAVLLVDARQGLATQTKRHSFIVNSLGVKNIVLAINKMDLVDYSQERFDEIVAAYGGFAEQAGIESFFSIPMSALKGDNVVSAGANMPWYDGPTFIGYLDTVDIKGGAQSQPFRMPVQWVNRPNLDFRGFSGRITSGTIHVGDRVVAMPSGMESRVSKIITMDGEYDVGLTRESVTLCLEDEIDISRGDTLCIAKNPADIGQEFHTRILWMSGDILRPGQTYLMKIGTQMVNAKVSKPKYVIDMNTLSHLHEETLHLNEIGQCDIHTDKPITFEPYASSRDMGGFILINRLTNATVAMGLIENKVEITGRELRSEKLSLSRSLRAGQKNQSAVTLWFTGFKWSGKTFIANALERRLYERGCHSFILDAENIWKGLSEDLKLMSNDRSENNRRVAHVSQLMNEAGLITLVCFCSPYLVEREHARNIIGDDNFIEIHVDTPLAICEAQDKQGYYEKARKGLIRNAPGIDIAYEKPLNPDLKINMKTNSVEEAVETVMQFLIARRIVPKGS